MSIVQYRPENGTVYHQWTRLGLQGQQLGQQEQLEQQKRRDGSQSRQRTQKQPRVWKQHLSKLCPPLELGLRLQHHSIHSSGHREDSCSLQRVPSLLCKQQQLAPQQLGLLGQVQQQLPQHDGQEGWWLQPTETIKVKTNKIVFLTTYLESQSVTDVVHSLHQTIGIDIAV